MLLPCLLRRLVLTVPLVFVAALLLLEPARSDQEAGTAIPAESRPCVDCHAFEFMQRALQDLKKTAYNLDTRYPVEFSVGLSEKLGNFVKSELT
ncbi:UNVERIFIED_CONTAM: hypothetical protein H355_011839 [Colinus virginianus]|nr:hypothetical protein H355_011839 [Colinus virginianus]